MLTAEQLARCVNLKVAADLNAVPPAGIEGIALGAQGEALHSGSRCAVAVGALAIGNVKYQVMRQLFLQMLRGTEPLALDFRQALDCARALLCLDAQPPVPAAAEALPAHALGH